MHSIYKYKLGKLTRLTMPTGAKVISVGLIDGQLFLWAEVDTKAVPIIRCFYAICTGSDIDFPTLQFLGTVIFPNQIVFHIFEVEA